MNIANKLTLLRVILVPFFAFFMLAGDIVPYSYLWAAVIFAVASITDTADGKIARKYNMVTNFGKFLDPLADKVLVVTALICFVELGWASAWVTAIIVAREFVVSGIRLIAAGSTKLDLEDTAVSNFILPLGSFVFILFCVTKKGWGWDNFVNEANIGKGLKIKRFMRGYMTYVLPVLVMFVFIMGLVGLVNG